MRLYRRKLLIGSVIPLAMALSACGGGGSSISSTPTPPVAPVAPPPPPPPPVIRTTPTPDVDYNTAEYQRSNGASSAKAIAAYQQGATGKDIVAAIIDSGINPSLPDFAGRIIAASTDTAGSRGLGDDDGHGTAVAGVLAAAKNDTGVQGVAYNAKLLIVRTDTPGSCTDMSPPEDERGCSHSDRSIARGVDLAIANSARVINISLGGTAADRQLRAAIDRATMAGIVIVISAGNEFDTDPAKAANPDPLAQIALDSVSRGLVIIAGAVDANEQIASFSNRAGIGASQYLTALGVRVRTYDQTGSQFLYSGTSFSAPIISGAVALLAEAFPSLTGKQLVELLFNTARDLGVAGDDSTYGQGVLDIARAFQPQGQLSLAGSKIAVTDGDNGTTSAPMGDGGQTGASLKAVVLDSYDRAYALDLSQTLRTASPSFALTPALQSNGRHLGAIKGATAFSVSLADNGLQVGAQPLFLNRDQADMARATAGFIANKIDQHTQIALGFSTSGDTLSAHLKGKSQPAFLIADSPLQGNGFERRAKSAFAMRHILGSFGLTASAEQGQALLYERNSVQAQRGQYSRYGYNRVALGLDRNFGPLALGIEASQLSENNTVLGARFGPAIGGGTGATSWFIDIDTSFDAGNGWTLGAAMRQGWTRAHAGGALRSGAMLRTNGFSFDVGKTGLFRSDDRFSWRISQPLRVSQGGFNLTLPSGYDYDSLQTLFAVQRLNLAPKGREVTMEAAYGRPLWLGWMTANLYYRRDPGNLSYAPDDMGLAFRFSAEF